MCFDVKNVHKVFVFFKFQCFAMFSPLIVAIYFEKFGTKKSLQYGLSIELNKDRSKTFHLIANL